MVLKFKYSHDFLWMLGMCSIEYTESVVAAGLDAFDLGAVNAAGNTITAQVLAFKSTLWLFWVNLVL